MEVKAYLAQYMVQYKMVKSHTDKYLALILVHNEHSISVSVIKTSKNEQRIGLDDARRIFKQRLPIMNHGVELNTSYFNMNKTTDYVFKHINHIIQYSDMIKQDIEYDDLYAKSVSSITFISDVVYQCDITISEDSILQIDTSGNHWENLRFPNSDVTIEIKHLDYPLHEVRVFMDNVYINRFFVDMTTEERESLPMVISSKEMCGPEIGHVLNLSIKILHLPNYDNCKDFGSFSEKFLGMIRDILINHKINEYKGYTYEEE